MRYKIVIPARYESSRLPGKVLLDIAGKPMLQHVYERAMEAKPDQIVIATDHPKIKAVAESFGAQVCITASTHQSGTERIAEVIDTLNFDDEDIVVNLQGDEPFISATLIQQVANNLIERPVTHVATLCERMNAIADVHNPNIVKVVFDESGHALYFSRSPIPWASSDAVVNYYHHIGLYAYRAGFVKEYVSLPPSHLEQQESLEQLRVLWYGKRIHVDIAIQSSAGMEVNTQEDLDRVREVIGG